MSSGPLRRTAVFALLFIPLRASASGPAGDGALLGASLVSLAAVLVAAGVHWGLRRVGRRLPRALARRAGKPAGPGVSPPWEGSIRILVFLATVVLWLTVAAYVTDQFPGLARAREMFMHVVVMSLTSSIFVLNGRGYSALDILALPAVLAAVWVAVSGVTHLLKVHVLRATHIERGAQEAVAMLSRYVLLFVSLIVVLQIWGIDASSLTFVASVLGVGIGFGLQHIANNFVSGMVLSLERPIQPGDFVKVGEWTGTVERVGPRNTEIRTNDNVSILVPNSRFLETEVVNWTHGDPVCRLPIPVGVAYGSDIARVRAALLDAARSHRDVLSDPRPRVEFRGFGDSALNFELKIWTREPRKQLQLISDLNYRIEANLRRYHVTVPFPQRDLHLRSPQLDRMLTAVGRRYFSEAESAVGNEHEATDHRLEEGRRSPDRFDDEYEPRTWTDEEIESLIARWRGPSGVPILDRRHLFTVYRQCFVGREAVDWMTRTLGLTRAEAVEVGRLLVDRGIVHHVLDEHGFKDGHFFYQFRAADGMQPGDRSAAVST
jgi:potassium efflux system protein